MSYINDVPDDANDMPDDANDIQHVANPEYTGDYKFEIENKKLKDDLMISAIVRLINLGEMALDLNILDGTVIKFGYLFTDKGEPVTLFKIIRNDSKVFYFATKSYKDRQLILLNEKFNEQLFEKCTKDMLKMHHVDIDEYDINLFEMELSNDTKYKNKNI